MVEIVESVAVPTPGEALAEWTPTLRMSLSMVRIGEVHLALADIYSAAHGIDTAPSPEDSRQALYLAYLRLKGILAATPLGAVGGWTDRFWASQMGALVFACFEHAYGSALLTQSQAATRLGIKVTRLGALQREHRLDYLVDPRAAHPARNRRRMTTEMIEDYEQTAEEG